MKKKHQSLLSRSAFCHLSLKGAAGEGEGILLEQASLIKDFKCPICGGPTTHKEQNKTIFKTKQILYLCINPECGTKLSHDFDEKKKEFMDGVRLYETKRENNEIWKLYRYQRLAPEQWEGAQTPAGRKAFEDAALWGAVSPAFICPHCQTKGFVHTKSVTRKKGISGGKATGAILTGGLSILATGLSRHEDSTQAHCTNCNTTWDF